MDFTTNHSSDWDLHTQLASRTLDCSRSKQMAPVGGINYNGYSRTSPAWYSTTVIKEGNRNRQTSQNHNKQLDRSHGWGSTPWTQRPSDLGHDQSPSWAIRGGTVSTGEMDENLIATGVTKACSWGERACVRGDGACWYYNYWERAGLPGDFPRLSPSRTARRGPGTRAWRVDV